MLSHYSLALCLRHHLGAFLYASHDFAFFIGNHVPSEHSPEWMWMLSNHSLALSLRHHAIWALSWMNVDVIKP